MKVSITFWFRLFQLTGTLAINGNVGTIILYDRNKEDVEYHVGLP